MSKLRSIAELRAFYGILSMLSVVVHLPIGVAVVAALLAHALQTDLIQHLLAVQLVENNHPLPLPFWNIPVYSGSSRIRGDQDSVDENYGSRSRSGSKPWSENNKS